VTVAKPKTRSWPAGSPCLAALFLLAMSEPGPGPLLAVDSVRSCEVILKDQAKTQPVAAAPTESVAPAPPGKAPSPPATGQPRLFMVEFAQSEPQLEDAPAVESPDYGPRMFEGKTLSFWKPADVDAPEVDAVEPDSQPPPDAQEADVLVLSGRRACLKPKDLGSQTLLLDAIERSESLLSSVDDPPIEMTVVQAADRPRPAAPMVTHQAPPSCFQRRSLPLPAEHTGKGKTIAILDSGVHVDHRFFDAADGSSRVVRQACFSTDDPSLKAVSLCPGRTEFSEDPGSGESCSPELGWCEHGTHAAGIAAGRDPADEVSGVASDADILSIQVYSCIANIGYCQDAKPCILSFLEDRLLALEYVYEMKMKQNRPIAAVYMGQSSHCPASPATPEEQIERDCLELAIEKLASVGIPVIVPSGNEHQRDKVGAPACIPEAIAVGATNDHDAVAGFSNVASPDVLDLLAPGVLIESAVPPGFEPKPHDTGCRQGTSVAAAYVAGAFTALAGIEPSPDRILSALKATGKKVDDRRPGHKPKDLPRVDVCAAAEELKGAAVSCSQRP
jgi:subtilisin family serine protease